MLKFANFLLNRFVLLKITEVVIQDVAKDLETEKDNAKLTNKMLIAQEVIDSPSPDYYKHSIASVFICFAWGISAVIASAKARKSNEARRFVEARHWSHEAHKRYRSSVQCFLVTIFLVGVPTIVSLATQGDIRNYPSAKMFFG